MMPHGASQDLGRGIRARSFASSGRLGSLEVRLARSPSEIRQAQQLRYSVFMDEMGAAPGPLGRWLRRDQDRFDAICDHLLVLDHEASAGGIKAARPRVVATYRLLRAGSARRAGRFYSEGAFDLSGLLADAGGELLEVGRSCVLPAYRDRRAIELLWQGLWAYIARHRVELVFGCASLPGVEPSRLAPQLAVLRGAAAAPAHWRIRPRPGFELDAPALTLDPAGRRRAFRALPPLVKGYLRLGAVVGDGAAVDRRFGTSDVLVVLRVADVSPRHRAYFAAEPGEASGRGLD